MSLQPYTVLVAGKGMSFGESLRSYRKAARLTQRELADALGVDYTYVSKIEGNRVPPPARDKIQRAAEVLGLNEEEAHSLISLAEKVPEDLETWMIERPSARRLYRSLSQASEADQEAMLDDLVRRVEEWLASGKRGRRKP